MKTFSNYSILLLLVFSIACSSKNEKTSESESTSKTETVQSKKLILFFGNSLTAGYGIEAEDAFPGLTAARIDSLGLDYRVINAGLSGETTASGLSRLDWFLEERPAIFILELGGNDGLRGITPSETKKNLKGIIQLVRGKYPETVIVLAGMQIPPNMGQEYTKEFSELFPQVAADENVELIPFLLEGVAGNPDLNLPDGIHPTEEGHLIVFETIWVTLKNLL
ncbi:arylesterase [Aquiflexum sp. LQ15W]|uniref:arylesterase n=1 Tax=Cognataquiflexum nitidum TaxID=2922272 RepID=UPI001F1412A9|nr:arylesterase [Cognataquiflexum nitidum]MCH6201755.1 arylesterase [Cognataquiflexum nitidum]